RRGAGASVGARERAALRRADRAGGRSPRRGVSRPRRCRGCVRGARAPLRPRADAARARPGRAAAPEVGSRAPLARGRGGGVRRARPRRLGRRGARGARPGRRAPPVGRRPDARRAARRRAGRRRTREQGDRAAPLRDGANRRGAPEARVREARYPLADPARQKTVGLRYFGAGGSDLAWSADFQPTRKEHNALTATATTTETIRNGVDTAQLFGTLDAIKADPGLARFQFRAHNRWIDGAHNRSTIKGFYAAKQEDASRAEAFTIDAGEPAILLGSDTGAN